MNLSELITDSENSHELHDGGKSHWYKVSGYCTFYTNPDSERLLYYLACPACKKKVTDESTGYRCENCNKSFGEAIPTYNFGFRFSDYSNSIPLQCLGEIGEQILDAPAVIVYQEDPSVIR